MQQILSAYKEEINAELKNILRYWQQYTPDNKYGGFFGKIDNDNTIHYDAPKGAVLNSRILWSFSTAYNTTKDAAYLKIADRAYNYISDHFIDKEFGGVYWTVDNTGKPLDTKKQFYALAFAVYGLSEYYLCNENEEAKQNAIALYRSIVKHSYENSDGGYIEALSREWKQLDEIRLSAKDANEPKSMNTHLHVLEAFASLYRIWPDEILKKEIQELINIFLDHIIDNNTHHLLLFFDNSWNSKSSIISYGHDIEAAWLIQEAAEIINDEGLINKVKKYSIKLADAAAEGLDTDGGLWYEYGPAEDHLIKQKHSWPQVEAMVGFFNAWQLTGDEKYLQMSLNSWRFIQNYILNKKDGEWYWGVEENHSAMQGQDKVGIWKCPYHSTRACLEIMHRIDTVLNSEKFTHLIHSEIPN